MSRGRKGRLRAGGWLLRRSAQPETCLRCSRLCTSRIWFWKKALSTCARVALQRSKMPANSWVVCLRANTKARVRMFCFPYAGGGAAVYSTWTRALQETIELYAIRPPGRESRLGEPPLMRISHYLAPLVSALESLLDQPFVFFGCAGIFATYYLY